MTIHAEADLRALVATAAEHHRSGRLREAETAYRAALAAAPGRAAILQNLGVLAVAKGERAAALDHFDAAIAADPQYACAHYNRAALLSGLGARAQAMRGFERVCALEPDHYDAHRALGFLRLAEGERGRALDHFARTYELRRGEDRIGLAAASLTSATRSKLLHDAEQFRYLSERRRDGTRFKILAQIYEEEAVDLPEEVAPLSARRLDRLGDDYNTAIALCVAPELAGPAVCARPDHEAIMRRYAQGRSGAAYFDDLLTPAALAALKRYLAESTIWHDFGHIRGFVASYLEDGLACPLVLQIADEIRRAFPTLLAQRALSQAWAFKGLESAAAIAAHADDAAVSVNFWLTPDDANLDADAGGLAVCLAPPPREWKIKDYDADKESIAMFLRQHRDDVLIAPYRENRAVLFESRLFHHSDAPRFKTGYENHRINLTLLFGEK